jgi:ankyrin repeat protein
LRRFLWVKCQLDLIFAQPSKDDIQKALGSLPNNMNSTYSRILDRIKAQDSKAMVELARRALTWVVMATRPLGPYELAELIAIESSTKSLDEITGKYQHNAAIEACCGLLNDDDGFVRPIHFTVKEFLQENGDFVPDESEANAELARRSINYLLCEEFSDLNSWSGSSHGSDGLAYIFSYWDEHLRRAAWPLPGDLRALLKTLFECDNLLVPYSVRIVSVEAPSVWQICALFGILNVYNELYSLDNSAISSEELKIALDDAARGGSMSAVKALLGLMNEDDSYDHSWLYQAASLGHAEVVRFFISRDVDKRADINAQGGEYGNALQAAAYGYHTAVVQILLEKGADINAQGGEYGNALQAAAYRGSEEIVQILLEKGADVNAQGGAHGNALQAAACGGSEKIVQILLEKGADFNAQGGPYGNALQAAAFGGSEKIVQILLEKGADVNAQGGRLDNALQAAAWGGRVKIVQILLEKGADVNAQGGRLGNALQAAAYGGHKEVVKILLEKGADPNAHGGQYDSALKASLEVGSNDIAELLVQWGAIKQ